MSKLNIKTLQFTAFSKKEAEEKSAAEGIQSIKDATIAWKKAGSPQVGAAYNEFCAEYLKKNTKNAEGIGCIITLKSGVADTKDRPYKVEIVKNEKGKRSWKTAFNLIDRESGKLLKTVIGTKKIAEAKAKELYVGTGYKGTVDATYAKVVTEGETKAFVVKYNPSVTTVEGSYLVFGIQA